ncbi:iron chaperone [Janibacter sp. GXQ6167]|uniref:iron chaperone n=1 Tax=Janibacter sp. GXQ6167 TaxID=3240791 RepID=UPI00352664FC
MIPAPEQPVTDYVADLPEPRRGRVEAIYATARRLAPEAVEGMKYAMPALVVGGKGYVAVMSTKKHIGLYPFSSGVVGEFADDLAALGIATTKGAIQIPDEVPLPSELLEQILAARLRQIP